MTTGKVFSSFSKVKVGKGKDYAGDGFYLHASQREFSACCKFSETDFSQYPIRDVKNFTSLFRLEHKSQFVQETEWSNMTRVEA